jgi:hypothetical protein
MNETDARTRWTELLELEEMLSHLMVGALKLARGANRIKERQSSSFHKEAATRNPYMRDERSAAGFNSAPGPSLRIISSVRNQSAARHRSCAIGLSSVRCLGWTRQTRRRLLNSNSEPFRPNPEPFQRR